MKTRHAESEAEFNQERYCSSPELQRGLMANLVAKRCSVIDDAKQRQLVWFVQLLSHAQGGLAKLATDLLAKFPECIATLSMQRFGIKPGQNYSADQVRKVRVELPNSGWTEKYPLKGELKTWGEILSDNEDDDRAFSKLEAEKHPSSYPASIFVERCNEAAKSDLEKFLAELCLDPATEIKNAAPWYFPKLIESLDEYLSQWIEIRNAGRVVTELGSKVYDTLDYCLESNCMALIDGLARTGKSFSAKAWCDLHPGQARYVQVPSSSDDIGFFRAIAKSLGVSINLNSKAQQLRDRVEEVLQQGDLMLVMDEAHYLWPQSNYREALPARVNWLMTALVNHNVAVALITTPQFIRTQKRIEQRTSWTSEQFIGRIGHYEKLPDSLSPKDLSRVAESLLPEGDSKSVELLTVYAQSSAKYLAGIEAVVRRSKYLAHKQGRQRVTGADIKAAIKESVIPSDSALAQALQTSTPGARRRAIAPVVEATLQAPGRTSATAVQTQVENNFAERKSAVAPEVNRIPQRGNLQEA
jgi:hypothetical protein